MVIGLLVVVYLISSNNGSTGGTGGTGGTTANGGGQPTTAAQNPTPAGAAQDDNATLNPNATAGPTEEPPPRMPLADFKALYDNPAKRPLIIDVRAKEAFDAGHIKGSISFPESDVDTRVGELPKDKLVVAYCQWPAENESARVATKLHSQYGYSYDNLKVLLGGWNTWNQEHAKDPNGYPTDAAAGVTPGDSKGGGQVVTATIQLQPAPANTVAPKQ
jgi:rhodanese-related sulfurtransferase